MGTKPESEFSEILRPMLRTNQKDGLAAELAEEAGVTESTIQQWCDGRLEPKAKHLRAIIRVLRRRDRDEEADIVAQAVLLDTDTVAVPLPKGNADDDIHGSLLAAHEQFSHLIRETPHLSGSHVARAKALQIAAHVWSATRALQTLRLAVGA
jgi:transcriptional regulator with XRE-family HTH domain